MQLKDAHSPLILPVPSHRLTIKADLTVFEHILLARHTYALPPIYQELLNAIPYADYIADVPFVSCISARIQIPRTKLSYSIPFEELRKIVRNRFHQISHGTTLRPPPQYTECIKCGRPPSLDPQQFVVRRQVPSSLSRPSTVRRPSTGAVEHVS